MDQIGRTDHYKQGLIYNRCVKKKEAERGDATSHKVMIYKNKLVGRMCAAVRKLWAGVPTFTRREIIDRWWGGELKPDV